MVIRGQREVAPAEPVVAPTYAPYKSFISGSGIIEAASENVRIGTPSGGLIEATFVRTGEEVKKGDPLFRLDTRSVRAELDLQLSEMVIDKTRVMEAEAAFGEAKNQLRLAERIKDKRAISIEELDRRRWAADLAEARLLTAMAEVARGESNIDKLEVELDRLTVCAPIDGVVLQDSIHVGEYVSPGANGKPLILLGVTNPMHVRVDIDETDAWRFQPGEPAIGVLRGNPHVRIPLSFIYVEPYVIPKQSLTGEIAERVDTRVLQVLYAFDPTGYPVYIGQQMDVYIQASPISAQR